MEDSFTRKFGVLVLFALAGAITFRLLFYDVAPTASIDLKYGRNEIMEISRGYLQKLGYDLKNYQQDAWFSAIGSTHLYFQTQGGIRLANDMIRADSLPIHHWYISWYDRTQSKSQASESFSMWVSPAGRPIGFQHTIKDSASLPSLSKEEAERRAEDFLRGQGIDLSRFVLKTSSETKQPNRLDHKFVWSDNDTLLERTIWVQVQGTEIGGYRKELNESGSFQKMMSETSTAATFYGTAAYAVFFLLFFFIVTLFLKKYHEGEVGTRMAVMVFIGLFVVSVLGTINVYSIVGSSVQMGDMNNYNTRIIMFALTVFIYHVFLSVMVFAAWSVGESSSRTTWPRKMAGIDSMITMKFFTLDVSEGIIRGYAWGLILLGSYTAILYFLLPGLKTGLFFLSASGTPSAFVPELRPIFAGIGGALFSEIVFRLFFLSFLKEKTKKTWLSVLVSTALWTATAFAMWDIPFGTPRLMGAFGVLAIFGLIFSYLFLKYDLLTTVFASFIMIALNEAIPLFSSTGPSFVLSQWTTLGLLAVPPLLAIGGLARKQRFEFTLQTMPTHIQRISDRERMAKELEIARRVQMSLLPKMNPISPGYDISGICIPALEVGGDYYDFVNLGGKRIGIAIGDVSGKGVPAAIYMTLTKGILQSHAEDNVSPKTVLSKVNNLMYRTIDRNSFVSMFYAVLDPLERRIKFARAGQCPVIVAQRAGVHGSFLTPKGMALGLEPGKVFDAVLEEQELQLNSGEVLVFYTDGFTEAMTETGDEFGEGRLVESLDKHRSKSASDIIKGIVEDVQDFTKDKPQHDDMTMVVVKVE